SLIPEQTAAAIDQFNRMITEQRQATFDEISRREEALLPLLDRVDTVLETVRTVNADIQGTLSQVNGVQESLRQASDAVRQAGVAWEDTVNAVERTANTLMADDGSSPPSEPVTFAEISRSIDQLQKTAVELRLLLNEFNTASDSGTLGQGIAASVNELEHAMTGVVNLITIRVILVIALLFVAMVLYRLLTTWLSRRSHTRQAA